MSSRFELFGSRRERKLSKGEIFDVLQNQRRRYVLQYFNRFDGPVSLRELSTQIAAWEFGKPIDQLTKEQKKRVYTTLQQTHLRKMDDAGIVEYDPEEKVVKETPYGEDLTVYLELVPGSEFPWREYYLSLGAISTAIVVALWANLYPLTLLSPLQWAAVISVTFTLSAAYHTFGNTVVRLDDEEFPP